MKEMPFVDSHEATLGFADSPDAIQCRHCGKIKSANTLFFRKKNVGELRWQTVCRVCEALDSYRATTVGRTRLLEADPNVPNMSIPRELRALKEIKRNDRALKTAAQVAANRKHTFGGRWRVVRSIFVARRDRLERYVKNNDAEVKTDRIRGSNFYRAYNAPDGVVRAYVDALRRMYAEIIEPMRSLEGWFHVTGGAEVPSLWFHPMQQANLDIAFRKKSKTTPPAVYFQRDTVELFNPWLLTTWEMRETLRKLAPNGAHRRDMLEPDDPKGWMQKDWAIAESARVDTSDKFDFHFYPWELPKTWGPDVWTPADPWMHERYEYAKPKEDFVHAAQADPFFDALAKEIAK